MLLFRYSFLMLVFATARTNARMGRVKEIACIQTADEMRQITGIQNQSIRVGDMFTLCRREDAPVHPLVTEVGGDMKLNCNVESAPCTVVLIDVGSSYYIRRRIREDEDEGEEYADEDDDSDQGEDLEDNLTSSSDDHSTKDSNTSTDNNRNNVTTLDDHPTVGSKISSSNNNIRIGVFVGTGILMLVVGTIAALFLLCRRRRRTIIVPPVPKTADQDSMADATSIESPKPPAQPRSQPILEEDPSEYTDYNSFLTIGSLAYECSVTMEGFSHISGATLPSGAGFSVQSNSASTQDPSSAHTKRSDAHIIVRDIDVPSGKLGIHVENTPQGPVVRRIHADSPLADLVFEGDISYSGWYRLASSI